MKTRGWKTVVAMLAATALVVAACSDDSDGNGSTDDTGSSDDTELVGVFDVDAGVCDSAEVSGSHFRMVQPGGTVDEGPFMENADSPCTDLTYTALSPGTDGGLANDEYQPQPDPPFDEAGNGIADAILAPTTFFALTFAVSTNETDPQSGEAVPAPSVTVTDGTLSGDLRSVSVAWNGQEFNQGAPKPDGSEPGLTSGPTGTYGADTGRFTLTWTSAIVGGPFDGFTGVWVLEGTFRAA